MWEGHDSPLWRKVARWPEAENQRRRKKKWDLVNLARIRYFIETGRLDPRFPITQRHLLDSKCVRPIKTGVRVFNVNDYPFPYKYAKIIKKVFIVLENIEKYINSRTYFIFLFQLEIKASLSFLFSFFSDPTRNRSVLILFLFIIVKDK